MKKFAIDVRWMVGSFRGMGRYAWQLVKPLEGKLIAFAPSKTPHVDFKMFYAGKSFYPYWEQIVLPLLGKKVKVNYLILPYNTGPLWIPHGVKTVLVIHDLIFMKSFKELPLSVSFYQVMGRFYRRFIVPKLIKKADHIISVSEYTKFELESMYSPDCDVTVIPNTIPDSWIRRPNLPLEQRQNYFMTVAGEAPSKNLERLIEAYSRYTHMVERPAALKVVGVNASYHEDFLCVAERHNVAGSIEFLMFIKEDELMELYSNAKGFIFASLFEGFGIPLLESMASGTPIACSNTTSLPEVVGDCAYKFSPTSVSQITNGFLHLNKEPQVLIEFVQKGLERVKLYSESEISSQIKCFWASLDEK